ncbi:hypothetical protein W02_02600 [Nitrospira sp. KM1]|uniref:hypothetical protein n=1 Tax=Nitrospira sp. KM1 TaxID=1936990 RepID=UPI0013A7B0B7|nr:hypothetical protein [Nitrospira sp. KM1]BCA53120.1 hypothetical protein W02_02600 [Nitrospira sp. KM1]
MIKPGPLVAFGFIIFLTGCAVPCAPPGLLADDPVISCFYQLTITNVDMNKYQVTAKLPSIVYEKDDKESKYPTDKSKFAGQPFTFRVHDLDKLGNQLEQNKTYEFVRIGNSAYLELLPGGPIQVP